MDWLAGHLAPLMFAALVLALMSGVPVVLGLAACGLGFALLGIQLGLMPAALLQALPLRLVNIMENDLLLAIPFFTLMGLILDRCGLARDLLETIGELFGPVRGGLAFAVVLVGALLGATTGVIAASVISMGLFSLPLMLRHGYDPRLASGVIAASGSLTQIVPPSLVLIVLADQLGRSVGEMYAAALVPAALVIAGYLLVVAGAAWLFPHMAPALPSAARAGRPGGARQRHRHRSGRPRRDLREVPPGRRHADRQAARHRPRPSHQPPDRRAPRRPAVGRERPRPGRHVLLHRSPRHARAGRGAGLRARRRTDQVRAP